MKIKPHQVGVNKEGKPIIKARFRRAKHRGFQAGAFGKPSK